MGPAGWRMKIQEVLQQKEGTHVRATGRVTHIREFRVALGSKGVPDHGFGGAFLGLEDDTGKIQLLCVPEVLPLHPKRKLGGIINLRLGDTIEVEGPMSRTEKGNLTIHPDLIMVVARAEPRPPMNGKFREHLNTCVQCRKIYDMCSEGRALLRADGEVVHLVTQCDQPYGSVRKCCERCGIMTIGPDAPRWTDDPELCPNETELRKMGLMACNKVS